jgi:TetR/AcrR family transcriptional regulator
MKTSRSFKPGPDRFALARGDRETALRQTRSRLILEGAWKVFARDGLDGATMRAIALEAGCTTGAIYPLFPSKEAIYASLLAESLQRLFHHVSAAVEGQQGFAPRLRAGALAFVDYYRARADEVTLGLYLWHGVRPQGLSRDLDSELNRRLGDTLALLQTNIDGVASAFSSEVGTGSREENASKQKTRAPFRFHRNGEGSRQKPGTARHEVAALFAFLIGALVVNQTGRLKTLGSSLDGIVELHIEALTDRLQASPGTNAVRSP